MWHGNARRHDTTRRDATFATFLCDCLLAHCSYCRLYARPYPRRVCRTNPCASLAFFLLLRYFRSGANTNYKQSISIGYGRVRAKRLLQLKIYGYEALSRESTRTLESLKAVDFLPNDGDYEELLVEELSWVEVCLERYSSMPSFEVCARAAKHESEAELGYAVCDIVDPDEHCGVSEIETIGDSERQTLEIEMTPGQIAVDDNREDIENLIAERSNGQNVNSIDGLGDDDVDDDDGAQLQVEEYIAENGGQESFSPATHFSASDFKMMAPSFENLASARAIVEVVKSFGKEVQSILKKKGGEGEQEDNVFSQAEKNDPLFQSTPIMEDSGFNVYGDNSPAYILSRWRAGRKRKDGRPAFNFDTIKVGDMLKFIWIDGIEYDDATVLSCNKRSFKVSFLDEGILWEAKQNPYSSIVDFGSSQPANNDNDANVEGADVNAAAAAAATADNNDNDDNDIVAPGAAAVDDNNDGNDNNDGDNNNEYDDAELEDYVASKVTFVSGGFHLGKEGCTLLGKVFSPHFLRDMVEGWRPSLKKQDWFLFPGDPTQTYQELVEYRHAHYNVGICGALKSKASENNTSLAKTKITAREVKVHMVECARKSPLTMAMLIHLRFVEVMFMLQRSERTSNFELYQRVVRLLFPLFCVANASHYARTFSEEMRAVLLMSPAELALHGELFTRKTVNGKNIFPDKHFEWVVKWIRSFTGKKWSDAGNSENYVTDINMNLEELVKNRMSTTVGLPDLKDRDETSRPTTDPSDERKSTQPRVVSKVFAVMKCKLTEMNIYLSDKEKTEVDESYLTEPQRSMFLKSDYLKLLSTGWGRAEEYFNTFTLPGGKHYDAKERGKAHCDIGIVNALVSQDKLSLQSDIIMATTSNLRTMRLYKSYRAAWYKKAIKRIEAACKTKLSENKDTEHHKGILASISSRNKAGISKLDSQFLLCDIRKRFFQVNKDVEKEWIEEINSEAVEASKTAESTADKKKRDEHKFLCLDFNLEGRFSNEYNVDLGSDGDEGGDEDGGGSEVGYGGGDERGDEDEDEGGEVNDDGMGIQQTDSNDSGGGLSIVTIESKESEGSSTMAD